VLALGPALRDGQSIGSVGCPRTIVIARIRETSEPAEVENRIATHGQAKFDTAWQSAVDKQPQARLGQKPHRMSRTDARTQLEVWAGEDVGRAFAGEPLQVLVRADVGAGKTTAQMKAVLAHSNWRSKRTVVLTHSHQLARQIIADLRKSAPEDAALFHHRKGRQYAFAGEFMCQSRKEGGHHDKLATWVVGIRLVPF
jgi:Rad3-related DNA helicase